MVNQNFWAGMWIVTHVLTYHDLNQYHFAHAYAFQRSYLYSIRNQDWQNLGHEQTYHHRLPGECLLWVDQVEALEHHWKSRTAETAVVEVAVVVEIEEIDY